MKRIITLHFGVEIEEKNKELQLIEERLAEGEQMLVELRNAWNNSMCSLSLPAVCFLHFTVFVLNDV